MKYNESFETLNGGRIEIANTEKGGNSSWGIKEDYEASSVRLAWYNNAGKFDPISSAEIPIWGLKELIIGAANREMIDAGDLAEIISVLSSSISRQLK